MSGEPKTLTPEQEKAAREAFETRYRGFAWWTERFGTQHPALRKDENGDYLEEVQRKYWKGFQEGYAAALGVPVVARDEANDNGLRNAVTAFVDKHFVGGSKANRPDYWVNGVTTADVYALREALYAARGTTPLQDHKLIADLRDEAAELRAALDVARDAMVSALVYHHHSLGNPVKEELNAAVNRAGRALAGGENEK